MKDDVVPLLEGEWKGSENHDMMPSPQKHKLQMSEALLLALPFLALPIAWGLYSGKLSLNQWPPQAEMRAGLWFPFFFCVTVYIHVLWNLSALRDGSWKWYQLGLISVVGVLLVWMVGMSIFEASVGRTERYKLGLDY